MSKDKIVRVLIAKPGLDGHDRGAKVVARALRDAGFEVIYTGLHQTPEMVVTSAIQEDVDVIGLSILSGAHLGLVDAIVKLMKREDFSKPIFLGGIIPDEDARLLKKRGVFAVYGPGSPLSDVVDGVRGAVGGKSKSPATKSAQAPNKKVASSKKTRRKKK